MRIEEATELDAISSSIARQELLGGLAMTAFAAGLVGMAGCVWFSFGFPGPELDHQWVRDQAKLHAGVVGAIALGSLFPAIAGGVASARILKQLDRLYRTKAFLEEVVRSRLTPVGRRSLVTPNAFTRGQPIVEYIDDRPDVYDIRRRMDELNAAFQNADADPAPSLEGSAGASETSAGDTPAPIEATFNAGGGDFGGGGATGDFSSND